MNKNAQVTSLIQDKPPVNDRLRNATGQPTIQRFRRDDAEILDAFDQRVRVLLPAAATGGNVCLAEVEVPEGNGPPYHVHRMEDETFFILDGQFDFIVNGERHEVAAGDVVFAPRNVPHTFRNIGAQTGVLQVLAVSAGFESFFRSCSLAFAAGKGMEEILQISAEHGLEFLPPETMSVSSEVPAGTLAPRITRRGDAEDLAYPRGVLKVAVSSADTDGACCVVQAQAAPGDGPPPHIHTREDEIFVVSSGEIVFGSGVDVFTAQAGDVVWAPRGTRHLFRCVSPDGASGLFIILPGAFEGYFRDTADAFAKGQASPASLTQIFEKYGLEPLAPEV